MTVISAVITRYCAAHASDSLITVKEGGSYEPKEWERSKIVAVTRWRGMMAYWGLARYDCSRSAFDWLQEQAKNADQYSSAEGFAQGLTEKLSEAISKMRFEKRVESGIGIHLAVYEYIEDYWIPEFFLLSNYTDPSYVSVHHDGVHLSRQTYGAIAKVPPKPEHRDAEYRLKVHEHLHQRDGMLIYNNGDPILFNAAANAILKIFRELARRKKLARPGRVDTYLDIARRPIEIVSKAQRDFCKKGSRVIGGRPHDLAVTPGGVYSSTTGDMPRAT